MDSKWISFLTYLFFCVNFTHGQRQKVFSSTHAISMSMEISREMGERLEDYIKKEEEKIAYLKWFVQEKLNNFQITESETRNMIGNPWEVYRFVKHYGDEWRLIEEHLKFTRYDTDDLIYSMGFMPRLSDLYGVIGGLARLQSTYNISSDSIASGNVEDYVVPEMSAEECCDMAELYSSQGYMRQSIDWYETARKTSHKSASPRDCQGDCNENVHQIKQDKELLIEKIEDGIKKNRQMLKEESVKAKENVENTYLDIANEGGAYLQKEEIYELYYRIKNSTLPFYGAEIGRNNILHQRSEQLCRNGTPLHKREMPLKWRKCFLSRHHPALMLQPLEIEVLSKDPDIFLYHRTLSTQTIDKILDIITKLPLEDNGTFDNPEGEKREVSSARVSQGIGIKDNYTEHRLEIVTGLKCDTESSPSRKPSSENVQIMNYGVGGRYITHSDAFEEQSVMDLHARYATFLLYFSDVTEGGGTIFHYPGIQVSAKKGSGILWYNFKTDGSWDRRTLHSGCPVLFGSKWISNKWITFNNQNLQCFNDDYVPSVDFKL